VRTYAKRFAFVVLFVFLVVGAVFAYERMQMAAFNPWVVVVLLGIGAVLCGTFVWAWGKWDLTARTEIPVAKPAGALKSEPTREIDNPVWKSQVEHEARRGSTSRYLQ
jgi:hypothetical protein